MITEELEQLISTVIHSGQKQNALRLDFKLSQKAHDDLLDCLKNIPVQDRLPFTIAYCRGYIIEDEVK